MTARADDVTHRSCCLTVTASTVSHLTSISIFICLLSNREPEAPSDKNCTLVQFPPVVKLVSASCSYFIKLLLVFSGH